MSKSRRSLYDSLCANTDIDITAEGNNLLFHREETYILARVSTSNQTMLI